MKNENNSKAVEQSQSTDRPARRAYEAPRVTKRRSVATVTLLSGSGATGVGVISTLVN
jgi:hypothetical protein